MYLEHCLSALLQLHLHSQLNNGLGKDKLDNCKTRWETYKFRGLVRLILEILRYDRWHCMVYYHITVALTHYGLLTPHDNTDLAWYWLRLWLVAWHHQAITWTNVAFSLIRFCGIHLREILQQVPKQLFCIISLIIFHLKSLSHCPEVNELIL